MPRVVRSSGGGSGGPSASIAAASSSSSSKSAAVDDRHAALRFWAPPPAAGFSNLAGGAGEASAAPGWFARVSSAAAPAFIASASANARPCAVWIGARARRNPRATSSPGKDASPCGVGAVAGARRASPWAAVRGAPGVAPGTGASKGPRARARGDGGLAPVPERVELLRAVRHGGEDARGARARVAVAQPRARSKSRGGRARELPRRLRALVHRDRARASEGAETAARTREARIDARDTPSARAGASGARPPDGRVVARPVRTRPRGRARAIAARGERSPTERFGTNVKIASVIAGHLTRGELRSWNVRAPRQI